MPRIELKTTINSNSIENVFNLSRSIDLHKISTKKTSEEAIAGKTYGLISLEETVTWKAKHLGFYQILTSKITEYQFPIFFVDEMVKGAFRSFRHEHHFSKVDNFSIIMEDVFEFESPYGILGKLVNTLFLKDYMKSFLKERNQIIKEYAESDKWKEILKPNEVS